MLNYNKIPIIDISAIASIDPAEIQKIADQVYNAYTKVGFAYVVNHGISQTLIEAIFEAAKEFHAQPIEKKLQIKQNKFFRGYMPFNSSIINSSSIGNTLKSNESEAFILAHEVDIDDPDYIAGINLAGPNQWPDTLPNFKNVLLSYHEKIIELSYKMLQIFSMAFGLNRNELNRYFTNPTTFLRLQHYLKQENTSSNNHFGVGPHTDYGFLTLLAQDEVGGLEVRDHNGHWLEVPPLPGSFVLNSGDMLKRMTNDVFISTPHRVVNRYGINRYSIPFFFDPNMHACVAPLSVFCSESTPAKYEPIEYCDHLMNRIRNNYVIGA